ncbi:hypothetical protein GN244_ATG00546 [Phytophthora infestans]|uniref:Uncharacterized protein n=1 Tax=Phytophthora infestans TaxID=4787 RepID=A0A833TUK7_PHYIN|nr:hypothetical protein GN244_ATG00546 [Phytophthora infestans]
MSFYSRQIWATRSKRLAYVVPLWGHTADLQQRRQQDEEKLTLRQIREERSTSDLAAAIGPTELLRENLPRTHVARVF